LVFREGNYSEVPPKVFQPKIQPQADDFTSGHGNLALGVFGTLFLDAIVLITGKN
jgi:hypothetical protein